MPRKIIIVVLVLYAVAALAFAAFIQLSRPSASLDLTSPVFVGEVIGRGLTVYVLSAIIPLVLWTFGRFRAERAAAPLLSWAIIGAALMGLQYVGDSYDRENQVANLSLDQKDREDFVRGTRQSCTTAQQQDRHNSDTGVTAQQIDAYCSCFADGLAKAIDIEEVHYAVRTGKSPASLEAKIGQIAPACSRVAYGR